MANIYKRRHRDTERGPREDRHREWGYTAPSQGMPRVASNQKVAERHGTGALKENPDRTNLADILISGF